VSPTVLSVGYPFAPVGADPVGGAEQVLAQLDRALVAQGWRSIVIAPEGSNPAGELSPLPQPPGEIDDSERARVHGAVREAIASVCAREPVDLIHLHGVDFDGYLPPAGVPTLVTLHLPLSWYAEAALRPERPLTWLNPVSQSQASTAPPAVRLTDPVENGVDVELFPRLRKRGFALALGRICPEKGFHLALDAARVAGVPLLLAGSVFPYPAHQRYFAEEILPRLDAQRRWLGPVSGGRKRRLMAAARCVVVPSLAAETSSLVAREAAAAGAPVIALDRGALAETVEHGRTGLLVREPAELAPAMIDAARIDPEVCRAVARQRFSLAAMTGGYLSLYRRLLEFSPGERSHAA
jgi:glycosyltransferase involved in cell wall biosynthesis